MQSCHALARSTRTIVAAVVPTILNQAQSLMELEGIRLPAALGSWPMRPAPARLGKTSWATAGLSSCEARPAPRSPTTGLLRSQLLRGLAGSPHRAPRHRERMAPCKRWDESRPGSVEPSGLLGAERRRGERPRREWRAQRPLNPPSPQPRQSSSCYHNGKVEECRP